MTLGGAWFLLEWFSSQFDSVVLLTAYTGQAIDLVVSKPANVQPNKGVLLKDYRVLSFSSCRSAKSKKKAAGLPLG